MNKVYTAWNAQLTALIAAGTKEGIPALAMASMLNVAHLNLQNSVPPAPALKEPKPNGEGE